MNGEKKKDGKAPGPQTYNLEKSYGLTFKRLSVNVNISGMSKTEGQKPTLVQADKLKVKSNRFIDMVCQKAVRRGVPGASHYSGVESAFDRQSSKPRALRSLRH